MVKTFEELAGTRWTGESELWLDPLGNEVIVSPCNIEVADGVVRYQWRHDEAEQRGSYTLHDDNSGGADFTDTWHSPSVMTCEAEPRWGLMAVFATYAAGDGPDWGWRSTLVWRPTDQLVLQMTNVAPWGEEARAVRMTCARQ